MNVNYATIFIHRKPLVFHLLGSTEPQSAWDYRGHKASVYAISIMFIMDRIDLSS